MQLQCLYLNCPELRQVRSRGQGVCAVVRGRARLAQYHAGLERLALHRKDIGLAVGQLVQGQHAVVGQRPLARQRHVAAADQPHIRKGVMRGATWAGGDQRCAVAGEASKAMDTRGLNSFGGGMAGRMVVSRRASIDVPAPEGADRSR
jgi:hypothetical protein